MARIGYGLRFKVHNDGIKDASLSKKAPNRLKDGKIAIKTPKSRKKWQNRPKDDNIALKTSAKKHGNIAIKGGNIALKHVSDFKG